MPDKPTHQFHSSDWKRFIQACQEGDESLVKHYLADGIDPDFQYPEIGTVALVEASFYGHVHIVQLLLEAGADTSIRQQLGGLNALEAAERQHHTEIVSLLARRKKDVPWYLRLFRK
jgi:ankyrin repeat protein